MKFRCGTPLLAQTLGVVLSMFMLGQAAAEATYPSRPVQMIVPFAAGGSTDLVGRIVAKGMSERLNQSVVVDNRAGASGSLGVGVAARAKPDGYIVAVGGTSVMLHQLLGRKITYNPQADLRQVGFMASSGMVVISRKDGKFKNLKELLEQAKAKPGSLSFGSAGLGSPGHLATEYMASMAKVKMVHVPYAGDSALIGDLIGGRIDFATVGIASVFGHMKDGAITALALTSRERIKSFPQLATVSEAGLAGYEADIWNMLVVPKQTPEPIVKKLNGVINDVMVDEKIKASLLDIGFVAQAMTQEEIDRMTKNDLAKWAKIIRESNIEVD